MKILPCTLASVIAIAVAGCRGDSTGASQAATLTLLASEQAAEDPPRFSDWSAPSTSVRRSTPPRSSKARPSRRTA